MQTVVLAAGQGTRMRPLTEARPKPLLPVAGRPLVGHTIEAAAAAGASRIVLVIGYGSDAVRDRFGGETAGLPVEYAVQERQKGTADAVRAARDHLDDGPFVVLNGDALYDHDSLATLYGDGGGDAGAAVGSYRADDPSQYGVLDLDANGLVTGVVEKPADPPSDLVNAGAYRFPADALDRLDVPESERGERELTDVLTAVCRAHPVRAVPFDRWLDVGRAWELLAANEWKLAELGTRVRGEVSGDADLTGTIVVESGASVAAGVVIEGPAYVGPNATVGPNAYLRGATAVGAGATVGHAVEVKNSVLFPGATVGHLSYVGDSVLGRDVNFGAGTVVANLRHDDEPVRLTVKGERVPTGRRKFGVVCGDRVKTGIDTSLNAGVTLSTGARTEPGETVTRDR